MKRVNSQGIIIFLVVGFSILLLLFLFTQNFRSPTERAPFGNAGLMLLLDDSGLDTTIARENTKRDIKDFGAQLIPLYTIPKSRVTNKSILEYTRYSGIESDLSEIALRKKISNGVPSYITLPKWGNAVSNSGIANNETAIPTAFYDALFRMFDLENIAIDRVENQFVEFKANGSNLALFNPQFVERESLEGRCEEILGFEPGALIIRCLQAENEEAEPVTLILDPDLFNNLGLAIGENALFAPEFFTNEMAQYPSKKLYFDATSKVTLTDYEFRDERVDYERSGSDFARFFTYPLSLIWGLAFLLFSLLFWRGLVRFGERIKPKDFEHERSNTSAIEAMARILRLSGNDPRLARDFVRARLQNMSKNTLGDEPGTGDKIDRFFVYLRRQNKPQTEEFISLARELLELNLATTSQDTKHQLKQFKELAKKVLPNHEFN